MARNEITGDRLVTKRTSDAYRDNFDNIFCKHDWCSDGDPGQGEVMIFTCSRCGKESRGVPAGYNKGETE